MDFDLFKEIWGAISKNLFRSILTGLGIFWGILIIILMMGASNGLENGIKKQIGSYATNSLFVWGQMTTKAYKGMPKGRVISFENADIDYLKENIKEIEVLAPRNQLAGFRSSSLISYQGNSGAFNVYGDFPEFTEIEAKKIVKGRFLNQLDIQENRKVCVIGEQVRDVLFGKNANPLGRDIQIKGISFMVIGVYGKNANGSEGANNVENIFVPFSTFQRAFNMIDRVGWFAVKVKDHIDVALVEEKIIKFLSKKYDVDPEDKSAIGHFNLAEMFQRMSGMFITMGILTWFIGGMTLIGGMIGISNIMLVVIKERTKEIGIKRALGATPVRIVGQIVLEAIFLTLLAGYLGILLGMLIVDAIGPMVETDVFTNPQIDLSTVFTALTILVVSGIFSGWIPARKAILIKPVDALRTE